MDDVRHGMALQLEPQGMLFAEVSDYIGCNPVFRPRGVFGETYPEKGG